MLHDLSDDKPADSGADAAVTGGQLARQEAIRQIERRRGSGSGPRQAPSA